MIIALFNLIVKNHLIYVTILKIRGTFCYGVMKVVIVFFFFMKLNVEIKKAPLLLTIVCSIGA